MPSVKTAISIDEQLFERANSLARELGVPRSHVFTIALEDYLRRRESQALLDQINAALEDDPQEEERQIAREMERRQRKVLDRNDPDLAW